MPPQIESKRNINLPVVREREENIFVVNSETLGDYLGYYYFPEAKYVFSPQLNLRQYTPAMQELYTSFKLVHVYVADEYRKALQSVKPVDEREKMRFAEFYEFVQKKQQSIVEEVAGERSLVIFEEKDTRDVYFTPPSFGTHVEADRGTAYKEIEDRGDIAITDAHTHPDDTLPSPKDYGILLLEDPVNPGTRMHNGIIVLCPNVQLLTLATSDTPIIDIDQLEPYIKTWSDYIKGVNDPFTQELNEIINKAQHEYWTLRSSLSTQYGQAFLDELEQLGGQTGVSAEDEEYLFDRSAREFHETFESLKMQHEQELAEMDEDAKYISENETILRLMQFVKLHSLKLYSSTNMQDFYEFTA